MPRKAGLFFAEKSRAAARCGALRGLMRRPYLRWAKRTTREVLEGSPATRSSIGVLTGQFGDYGLPPGASSFAMHAMLARHYLRGGFYPVGGSLEHRRRWRR